jgi:hypothetical protein
LDYHPHNTYHTQAYDYNAGTPQAQMWNGSASTGAYPAVQQATPTAQEANLFRALPAFRTGCTGDNYLGVSSGNSHLSSIKGTALSILGMEIDIADFTSTDMDEPEPGSHHPQLYNKSYQAFLQSCLNINPKIEKVDLPSRAEGLTYAQWYFRVINPYLPLLHKPTFIRLVCVAVLL